MNYLNLKLLVRWLCQCPSPTPQRRIAIVDGAVAYNETKVLSAVDNMSSNMMSSGRPQELNIKHTLRQIAISSLVLLILGATQADTWRNGSDWSAAFPEKETYGAFDPAWAAGVAAGYIYNPKQLIENWNRLPNDLHQWVCGMDGLGSPRRCLDMTFKGSGEYTGKAVLVHFDTIGGRWHFAHVEIVNS